MSASGRPPGGGEGRDLDRSRWARLDPQVPALYSRLEASSFAAEQYRNLAFQVEERKRAAGDGCYVLTVTSPDPGAGKTLTSLNLALTLAREGETRVLLVEGDLWKPSLRHYLELDADAAGLAQVLEGAASLERVVRSIWGAGLDVVVSGERGRAGGLLAHRRVSRVVEEMRTRYEIVILDSPPMMLASGRSLAACADGVVVVVRAGQTKKRGLEQSFAGLPQEKVVGMVLNATRRSSEKGYVYYSSAQPEETGGSAAAAPPVGMALAGARRWLKPAAALASVILLAALWLWPWSGDEPLAEGEDGDPAEVVGAVAAEPVAGVDTAAGLEPLAAAPRELFVSRLIAGARTAAEQVRSYDFSYVQLAYPGGDPGLERGTAVDLVVRAMRSAGIDLQREIHEEIVRAPGDYGVSEADPSIDHRRVKNLQTYLSRHGTVLGTGPDADWRPGDLVVWATDAGGHPNHVGVLGDRRGESGHWTVIHHYKRSPDGRAGEEDALLEWPIVAHYRLEGPTEG